MQYSSVPLGGWYTPSGQPAGPAHTWTHPHIPRCKREKDKAIENALHSSTSGRTITLGRIREILGQSLPVVELDSLACPLRPTESFYISTSQRYKPSELKDGYPGRYGTDRRSGPGPSRSRWPYGSKNGTSTVEEQREREREECVSSAR